MLQSKLFQHAVLLIRVLSTKAETRVEREAPVLSGVLGDAKCHVQRYDMTGREASCDEQHAYPTGLTWSSYVTSVMSSGSTPPSACAQATRNRARVRYANGVASLVYTAARTCKYASRGELPPAAHAFPSSSVGK